MSNIADTPQPPYYAVIFTSAKAARDDGYAEMGERLASLGREQPGFLGIESVRDVNGVGITVSYWESLDSIEKWKEHELHKNAQKMGINAWYKSFATRICKVEKLGLFKP